MWTGAEVALFVIVAAVAAFLAGAHAQAGTPCRDCAHKTALANASLIQRDDAERQIAYWRTREERATDRLLEVQGVGPVARPLPKAPVNPMTTMLSALGVTEIDSRRTPQPGQGSDLSGDANS